MLLEKGSFAFAVFWGFLRGRDDKIEKEEGVPECHIFKRSLWSGIQNHRVIWPFLV